MQTTITETRPHEFTLNIKADSEDLTDDVDRALRKHRRLTPMKGFRTGHMPLNLYRKLHSKTVAMQVFKDLVTEVFTDLVEESDKYDVVAGPHLTTIDYELDGDLHAEIQFAVAPKVTLVDLSQISADIMVHTVTDDEIDQLLAEYRWEWREYVPVEDDGVGEQDFVLVDLQKIDGPTGLPLVGEYADDPEELFVDAELEDEPKELFMDAELEDDLGLDAALSHALRGLRFGESATVTVDNSTGDGVVHYRATVREIKRPMEDDLDEELIAAHTGGECTSVDEFRQHLRRIKETHWTRMCTNFRNEQIMLAMIKAHDVKVPEMEVIKRASEHMRQMADSPTDENLETLIGLTAISIKDRLAWNYIEGAVLKDHAEALEKMFTELEGAVLYDGTETGARLERIFLHRDREMEQAEYDRKALQNAVFEFLAGQIQLNEHDIRDIHAELRQKQAEWASVEPADWSTH